MKLPNAFINQMKDLLGTECTPFLESMHTSCRPSIRLHPIKKGHGLQLADEVPWCANAYYLNERPVFTLNPFFHAGHFYVQEASSMFIDYILRKIKIPQGAAVLDLCSAPGGKATLTGATLSKDCFIHCHETDSSRAQVLSQNIARWGLPNYLVTQGHVRQLLKSGIKYDLILLDAPCSGEGMFRKEKAAVQQWNENKVLQCSIIQKQLIAIASELCKPNGYIVYSTCTYNQQENEQVIAPLLSTGNFCSVEIKNTFPLYLRNETGYTYRFLPNQTEGEGFTISVLQKNDANEPEAYVKSSPILKKVVFDIHNWIQEDVNCTCYQVHHTFYCIPKSLEKYVHELSSCCKILHAGIPLGQSKGDTFYPNHGLSQNILLSGSVPCISLDNKCSLDFLRCLAIDQNQTFSSTWSVASYQTAKLGWIKKTAGGLKNYYPINLRIHSL